MTEPCDQGERLTKLEQQDIAIQATLARIESSVSAIAIQLAKVSVLESNHGHQSEAVGRAFTAIADNKKAIDDLTHHVEAKHSSYDKFIYMVIGGAAVLSIMWTIFGAWLGNWVGSQITDINKAVVEMRGHIAADKVMSPDDIPKSRHGTE